MFSLIYTRLGRINVAVGRNEIYTGSMAMSRKNTGPVAQPGILDIEAYVPGKSKAVGSHRRVIKLSSNETPLGPSPAAIKAFQNAGSGLELYPDGTAAVLRDAIATRYGLAADRIICGCGSDELLNLLANAYLGAGDEAIYTEHGFLVYPIAIRANGATPVIAKEVELRADVDNILNKVSSKTKMVFLANPNNPTGTYLPFDEVRRLRRGLRDDILLVLDAAYAEYVKRNDYEAGLELVATTDNVVMTRTFSKIFGLANLRLGWAYCPELIIDVLNRIRGPFNVCGPAIAAGAAAIGDQAHETRSAAHNEKWSEWLTGKFDKIGLTVTPSVGNFLLVHFSKDGAHTARAADEYLLSRGIILRRLENYDLAHCLRMTVGSEEDNRATVTALTQFMEERK